VDQKGDDTFTGYEHVLEPAVTVVAVDGPDEHGIWQVWLDKTPFYVESGARCRTPET
jgi:hypothetical protein